VLLTSFLNRIENPYRFSRLPLPLRHLHQTTSCQLVHLVHQASAIANNDQRELPRAERQHRSTGHAPDSTKDLHLVYPSIYASSQLIARYNPCLYLTTVMRHARKIMSEIRRRQRLPRGPAAKQARASSRKGLHPWFLNNTFQSRSYHRYLEQA
jgi:hypothetical protein